MNEKDEVIIIAQEIANAIDGTIKTFTVYLQTAAIIYNARVMAREFKKASESLKQIVDVLGRE